MTFKSDWKLEYHRAYKKNFYYSVVLAIIFHCVIFLVVRSWNVSVTSFERELKPRLEFIKVKYWRPKIEIPKVEVKHVKKDTFSPKQQPVPKPDPDPKEEVIEVPFIDTDDEIETVEGGEVKQPELILKKVPEYPETARLMGIEGKVYLWVEIDEKGDVVGVEIHTSSGSDVLDKCAKRAAFGCKFTPAIQNGVPVKSRLLLPYKFILVSGTVE